MEARHVSQCSKLKEQTASYRKSTPMMVRQKYWHIFSSPRNLTVRFHSILYTEDRGEVEDRRDTTSMNVVWGIR